MEQKPLEWSAADASINDNLYKKNTAQKKELLGTWTNCPEKKNYWTTLHLDKQLRLLTPAGICPSVPRWVPRAGDSSVTRFHWVPRSTLTRCNGYTVSRRRLKEIELL